MQRNPLSPAMMTPAGSGFLDDGGEGATFTFQGITLRMNVSVLNPGLSVAGGGYMYAESTRIFSSCMRVLMLHAQAANQHVCLRRQDCS